MQRWPAVDRELRRRLLDEMRRRHTVERAARTPEERLRRADEIRALAAEVAPVLPARTDEPRDLLVRLKARWRAAGAPRAVDADPAGVAPGGRVGEPAPG